MAWHFGTTPGTSTPATGAQAAWLLFGVALPAAGWTRGPDSDGTTYASGGGQVTHGGSGANGLGNSHAWICVRSPGGSEIVFQRGLDNQNAWVKRSPAAGFIHGSPSATRVPSATDELVVVNGTGPDASPAFTQIFNQADGGYNFACAASDVAPYPFWWAAWYDTSPGNPQTGTGVSAFLVDGVVSLGQGSDPDPVIAYLDGSSGNPFSAIAGAISAGAYVKFQINGTPSTQALAAYPPGHPPYNGFFPDYGTGNDQAVPMQWLSNNGEGFKGQGANALWLITGRPDTIPLRRYTPSIETIGTQSYILIASTLLPWDGSVPATGNNGSYTAELVTPLVGAPPPAPPVPPAAWLQAQQAQVQPSLLGDTTYGVDLQCLDDLDPNFSLVAGYQVLLQDLYHRIRTRPGELFWAPNFGYDIRALLNKGVGPQDLSSIQMAIAGQIEADERVQSSSVALAYDQPSSSVAATILVQPHAGPAFQFVVGISQLSLSLLSAAA